MSSEPLAAPSASPPQTVAGPGSAGEVLTVAAPERVRQPRFPEWIRVKVRAGQNREDVHGLVNDLKLNTVCQSAKCPNINECWHHKSATFMILGNRCTRACTFCAIEAFRPEKVQEDEPERVAEATARLGLRFVVVTSVQRDDLPDKGAGHFVRTIAAIRQRLPHTGIEVLTPDFKGQPELIDMVVDSGPIVFNHNMETCARLTKEIRSGGRYERSLAVLSQAKRRGAGRVAIKSGIMVGLGESDAEVVETITDMQAAGVDILTIGQYLPPSLEHQSLDRYVVPEKFAEWAALAKELGFKAVASSPMVRSSYRAEELAREVLQPAGDWYT
jgi:lipoyl synthase